MPSTKYVLAVEELAYAMGVLGGTDTATGFLLAILGERPRLETEGRLLAASHALVARGFLDFNAETEKKWLEKNLEDAIKPMLQNDFSLRCSETTEVGEEVLTFYIMEDKVTRHHLQRSVVSVIETLPGWETVVEQLIAFFELFTDNGGDDLVATIPASLLESLQRNALNDADHEARSELEKYGVPESEAVAIIEAMKQSAYRGSVVKLELENDRTISDKGFLLLKGQNLAWLFVIEADDKPMMSIYRGTKKNFQQQLDSLTSSL